MDFEQLILSKISEGETMEDILTSITATANKIEATLKSKQESEEVKSVLKKGTEALIAELAKKGGSLDARTLMLVLMTWLYENCSFMEDISTDYEELLDKEAANLTEMIASVELLTKLFMPKEEAPEDKNLACFDPLETFFKEHHLI